jgi:hypothetical protein
MKILLLSLLSIMSLSVQSARFDLGTSLLNSKQGRIIPSVHFGLDLENLHMSFHSTGVKTELYYHNSYILSAYLQEEWGSLGTAKFRAGFGGGIYYSIFSYREDRAEADQKFDDVVLGPGLRAEWLIADKFFLSLESIMGVMGLHVIALTFQEVSVLSLGWRF